jgi:hypothetical protein
VLVSVLVSVLVRVLVSVLGHGFYSLKENGTRLRALHVPT